jgi:hypothetical protein
MNDPFLPKWVTEEPVYVTLVASDPDAFTTTILVERPMKRIPRTNLYQPIAFVIQFGEGIISVNGKVEDLAEEAMKLCQLADEARWACSAVGEGYYSDPDAS